MKKVVLLIALAVCSLNALSQNVTFLDLRNKEIAIIINAEDNSFKEYYLFQYEDLNLSGLVGGKCQVQHDDQELLLKFPGETLSFSITGTTKVLGAKVYSGYGLSHRKGQYLLNPNPPQKPQYIYELISQKVGNTIQPTPVASGIKCHSGGEGSTECSVDASAITGGGACSVKCRNGYYSCCDDTRNECRCKKNELTKAPKN